MSTAVAPTMPAGPPPLPPAAPHVSSPAPNPGPTLITAEEFMTKYDHLNAVLVLDPDTLTASVYRGDTLQEIFRADDELTLPDVLPGFSVPVRRFFA